MASIHSCVSCKSVPAEAAVDLRRLPCPQPLTRALELADALPPGGSVQVLTPLLPMPLLHTLSVRSFAVSASALADGSACVFIERPG